MIGFPLLRLKNIPTMDISHFFYPLICWCTLGCLRVSAIVSSAAMSTRVQITLLKASLELLLLFCSEYTFPHSFPWFTSSQLSSHYVQWCPSPCSEVLTIEHIFLFIALGTIIIIHFHAWYLIEIEIKSPKVCLYCSSLYPRHQTCVSACACYVASVMSDSLQPHGL